MAFFRKWFTSRPGKRRVDHVAKRRLAIEPLERRDLLAAFDLTAYERNLYFNLANPFTNDDEFSGAAYSPATNTFFVVDDGGTNGDMYEYGVYGAPIRRVPLMNFPQLEGMYLLNASNFVVLQENPRHVSTVTIPAAPGGINKNTLPPGSTFPVDHDLFGNGTANDGPEGIAWDAADGHFYVVKEKSNIELFRVTPGGGTVTPMNVPGLTGTPTPTPLTDVSDIYFYETPGGQEHLLMLSDLSQRIIDVLINDATNSGAIQAATLTGLPQTKFEGMTFDPTSFFMMLVADKDTGLLGRAYAQYRNFTVLNAAAPVLHFSSQTGSSPTVTSDTTPTFSGTLNHAPTGNAVSDAAVFLYVNNVNTGITAVTDASGNYLITAPFLAPSPTPYTIQVRAAEETTSPAAKQSPLSPALSITIDTAGPRVMGVTVWNTYSVHDPYPIPAVEDQWAQLQPVPVGGGINPVSVGARNARWAAESLASHRLAAA